MKLIQEDLWKDWKRPNTIYIVTTNSTLRKDGSLVMGRGAAKQATELVKGVEKDFGDKIKEFDPCYYLCAKLLFYGYLEHNLEPLAILQVKYFWGAKAEINLIKQSLTKLSWYIKSDKLYRMNFPGIGYGGLEVKEVLPLLQFLPDNVTICYK